MRIEAFNVLNAVLEGIAWLQDGNRDSMLDGLSVKDFGRYIASQLKKLYKKPLFIQSGLYSCLAIFPFGLMSVLPASPLAYLGEPAVPQTMASILTPEAQSADMVMVEKAKKNTNERCRLQADVALFLALREEKSDTSQVAVLCEKESQASAATASARSEKALDTMIREMTAGYPVERMAPAIAKYDRNVAALIVGIAKKESNWGKRVPLDVHGADCFNYWGYKGAGSRGVAMGHGCFGSPEEAVTAVGNRLTELVAIRQTSEPKSMIIWKCGSSCQGHSTESVQKWISDVSLYYQRIAVAVK